MLLRSLSSRFPVTDFAGLSCFNSPRGTLPWGEEVACFKLR